MVEFHDFGLSSDFINVLNDRGIFKPTIVQDRVIPLIFNKNDLIVQSETGSGKTLCFAIPIIELINQARKNQVLVITPTRELAKQVGGEFIKFSKHKNLGVSVVYGGTDLRLSKGKALIDDIIVGTPGRLLDMINRRLIDLTNVNYLIIDEVDELLNMGFIDDVSRIINYLPKKRQSLMFSATVSNQVSKLINKFLINPKNVILDNQLKKAFINQSYFQVEHEEKIPLLVSLVKQVNGLSLVFCNTKHATRFVANILKCNNINADFLNGDMEQKVRERVLDRFVNGDLAVLVATDVAARGIHVNNIKTVFNFDLPRNLETYTHRIGRTARQGRKGCAISIVSDNEFRDFRAINYSQDKVISKSITPKLDKIKVPKIGSSNHHNFRSQKRNSGSNKGNFRKRRFN